MAARSENMAVIIGNLTRDPELRHTPQGHTVVGFGVATNRQWTTSEGEKKEDTQFHEITAWNRLAEICDEFLAKGRKVYIKGRLRTRNWDDESGTRHYRTEIVAEDMIILDSRREPQRAAEAPADKVSGSEGSTPSVEEKVDPKDMPF